MTTTLLIKKSKYLAVLDELSRSILTKHVGYITECLEAVIKHKDNALFKEFKVAIANKTYTEAMIMDVLKTINELRMKTHEGIIKIQKKMLK